MMSLGSLSGTLVNPLSINVTVIYQQSQKPRVNAQRSTPDWFERSSYCSIAEHSLSKIYQIFQTENKSPTLIQCFHKHKFMF